MFPGQKELGSGEERRTSSAKEPPLKSKFRAAGAVVPVASKLAGQLKLAGGTTPGRGELQCGEKAVGAALGEEFHLARRLLSPSSGWVAWLPQHRYPTPEQANPKPLCPAEPSHPQYSPSEGPPPPREWFRLPRLHTKAKPWPVCPRRGPDPVKTLSSLDSLMFKLQEPSKLTVAGGSDRDFGLRKSFLWGWWWGRTPRR